ALGDHPCILIGTRIRADDFADQPCLRRRDGAREQIPVMEISGRSFDHEARAYLDVTTFALVRVTVGDQPKYPGGVFKAAAKITAQIGTDCARLDVDVESVGGVPDRGLDHVVDIVGYKAIGNHAFIDRADAADLQDTGRTGAVDRFAHVLADELNELANRR